MYLLQKLFKAKKVYIREEEHAKGYGKVSGGRITGTEEGGGGRTRRGQTGV